VVRLDVRSHLHVQFENCGAVELIWPAGAEHAAAWRWRYPTESEWRTREQELERRRQIDASEVEVSLKAEL
jgi:hypothetical protein